MASYVSCCILFRIVLPVIILTCVFFRPCVLSGIYLILLLLSSCFPVPSQYSMSGSTGVYLKLLIMISTFASFGQLIFQALMLLHWTPYGSILPKCEFIERLLRHCGFVRLDKLDVLSILVWVTPEAIMFITSIVFYILFSKLSKGPRGSMIEAAPAFAQSYHDIAINKQRMKLLTTLGKYLSVVALCLVAIMKPTVPGGFYFLLFLSTGTWWGCYKDLGRGYAYVLRFAMIVVFFHIFTFYAYQTDWPQDYLLPNSTYSRYFGFTILLETKCVEPRHFIFYDSPWLDYALLPSLIILFFILAISSKQLLEPQGIFAKDLRPSETTPLIQSVASTRYGIHQKGPAILQDSTGSVIVAAERTDDIALKEVTEDVLEHDKPTCFDQFIYVLESIFLFIIRTSYIGTNIIMMTWSITYHSWLTFVLLLWASLLWMVPNQRKFMLRSSPFLVFYAWFLIISSYIYSMDLTEEELPTKIDGIDLSQLGFIKVHDMPGKRLLVKSLYILAFWITLRQYMKERKEERQNVAMADMAAPLQISVGAAAGVEQVSRLMTEGQKHKKKVYPDDTSDQPTYLTMDLDELDTASSLKPSSGMSKKTKSNEVLQNVGSFIRRLLTKFWIWIVAITLFIVAITGQRMTSFRIMYMTLFVVFILSFQFSFRAWRKIMFAFWLTVIIFSMLILVIVYTYQFDNFPEYWTTYLHISPRMQADIGLEKYQTKQLFMKLATQTFFVIIAVVQLHYFHKDFLEMSKPNQGGITDTTKSEANSSAQGGAKLEESNLDEPDEDVSTIDLTDIDNVSSKVVKKKFRKILHYLYNVLNLVMLFLEIHMPKIIMFMVMVVCVMDVAAIYIILVIPLVLAATIGKGMVKFALNFSSFIAGLLLLLRMVYQIEYISHDMWNVNCTENSTTSNSAEWLGFYKISDGRNLPELVKWNIILVLSVTILCIVNLRQSFFRAARGEPTSRPFFMFPKAKVTNASNGLINYFQYLANYFYYRMGVEMCLIGMVATIGIRMDLYAMIYAFWLAAFFMMDRKLLARFWNVFLVYIAFVIPVQYIMVVGLPPNLCIEYPWDDNDILRNLQEWAFLMDDKLPPPPKKILCDFILLLLVARQSLVFRIEKRFEGGQDYPGGSNESVIHMAESRGFENPIPDYITYSRNYLDIMKKALFMPFMWVTLAIVFLAGTNRVNLFSVGYLLGSFYFLWEGSDIYLMPIPKILKRWNYLIGFNVFVIGMKVALQLVGCLFFDYIKNDVCWLIQLLGISCLRKFKTAQFVSSLSTDECNVGRENVGLAWDGACFAFLILMRRLFNSYHFFHIINESKASAILASRGADLIEELRQKRMVEQDEEERKIIEKIKTKMDRIKANQQKILGPNYQEPENHFIDTVYPKSNRPMYRRKEPKHYKAEETSRTHDKSDTRMKRPTRKRYTRAIRSGDYYMFDDMDQEEIDVFDVKSRTDEEAEYRRRHNQRTLSELLSSTMKTDVGTVVRSTAGRRRVSLPTQPKVHMAGSQISTHFSAPPVVRIQDEKDDEPDEPRPGTSREEEPEETIKPISRRQKIMDCILFLFAFIDSFMLSLTNYINKFSKDHRYVIRVLSKEKKILKETTDYNVGIRSGPNSMWQPSGSYRSLLMHSRDTSIVVTPSVGTCSPSDSYRLNLYDASARVDMLSGSSEKQSDGEESDIKALPTASSPLPYSAEQERLKTSAFNIPEIRILAPSMERGLDSPGSGQQVNFMDDYEQGEMSSYDQPTVLRLLLAVWYLILSHSDMVCYFMIFLNQTRNATFISLPLPLMVFLWGTLTVPRPSKTFWITIIAYTQVIVLIKCMFQFQILPWNRDDFNYSYQATRIIGVERKTNYAVWDLILLLVVYFHRFMLKCLGLWKVSYQPHSVLADGEYNIENGELKPMEPESLHPDRTVFLFNPSNMQLEVSTITKRVQKPDYWCYKRRSGPQVLLTGYPLTQAKGGIKPWQSRHEDLEQLVDESDAEDRVYVHATQIDPREMLPGSIKMTFQKYVEGLRGFFKQLFDPTSRVAADVYSYMFLCDFFNFFVILVGYSSFGSQQGDGGVSSYLQDNRVPVLFLVMLILQFLIIIVDRGIFLRKNIFAKIVFQFIQIFILHIWLFIIYPIMTERSVNQVLPPQMYYMVKCFYLLLSAYQIRCGYPTRILGNFLCKGYNYFYMILFKCFMLVPFLFELRTVMDWMWTDTSMTVFDWIKMEDIFTHIYQLKCARHIEAEYPQPRGERKKAFAKYSLGGLLLAIIIGIIWFPLVFFSLGNAVGEPNPPYDVQLDLRVGPYSPLYRMTAQSNSIYQFNENDFLVLQQRYLPNKIATTFLSAYDAADIAAVRLSTDSANVWSISPPDRARMVAEVNSSQAITIQLEYQIKHKTNTKEDSGLMRNEVVLKLEPFVNNQTNPIRTTLLEMLHKKPNDPPLAPLLLEYIMPKFVKATSRGTTQIITQLMEPFPDAKATSLRNLSLNIAHDKGQVWWEIKEQRLDHNDIAFLSHLPYNFGDSIILYTFNDKIFPQTLSLITGGGIIGLYSTLVFVASRLLRGFFSEICFKIMFDDMPYVDRVLQLCLDIYLVREAGEFCLEEDLFAKLVFLYRSPETLIKWTRPIEEVDDEDNPEGDNN